MPRFSFVTAASGRALAPRAADGRRFVPRAADGRTFVPRAADGRALAPWAAARRNLALWAAAATLLASPFTALAGSTAFDQVAFDKARTEGKPVAVQFHASWCPTCKTQTGVVAQVMAEPRFQGLTIYVADYDNSKALKQQLKVTQQSTFVVFKGNKEVARSTGQTSKEAIAQTLGKAL
jgi:thioredoxin 1